MKNNLIILIFFLVLSICISGCISEDNEEEHTSPNTNFVLKYSSASDVEEKINLTIKKDGNEVFNETITPSLGQVIYSEKASNNDYLVIASYNDLNTQILFHPDGQNILFLTIKNGNIDLQEITD
jgi:Tol biopolymer transport system component